MKARSDRGRHRATLLAVALALVATTGYGTAPQEDVVSFQIETITVEAQRLSPEIVLSESLLREGREYSETQLREAVHRINRLPFVLLAEFSLRKGSERGRYELVIRVYEARRWFFQLGLAWDDEDPFTRLQLIGEIDRRIGFEDDNLDALIGRRFALGRHGLLFASFATEDGPLALGYQRYNLFDRNILLSLTVVKEDDEGFVDGDAARAQLSIPIRGNHALRLLAGWNRDRLRTSRFGTDFSPRFEQRRTEVEAAWVFNSLDDPVLPRSGSLLEAGVIWAEIDDQRTFVRIDGEVVRQDSTGHERGVIVAAARHWPVTNRQSLSAGLGGFYGDSIAESRLLEAEANLGHQVFLLRNLEPGEWRELRFETQVTGLRQEFRRGPSDFAFPLTTNSYRLRTGLVYRNGWGLFSLIYEWTDREFG